VIGRILTDRPHLVECETRRSEEHELGEIVLKLLIPISSADLESTVCYQSCLLMQYLRGVMQWRNKVAVGPRASIPKGPPFPQKNFLKTASGKFWAPHSAGPACTARFARPIVTPLASW